MWYAIQIKWYDFLDWYDENRGKFWSVILIFMCISGSAGYWKYTDWKHDQRILAEELKREEQREIANMKVPEPDKERDAFVIKKVKPTDAVKDKVATEDGAVSMLLLGVDSRSANLVGRSDSMILVTMNKRDNKVRMVSIPRDSYVPIAGKGFNDKITHANAFGGQDMARETVEDLFGIHIDYAATINFASFEKVVDVLGGVTVDVKFAFSEKDRKGNWIQFNPGKQKLSGREALAYARMRHQDPTGDIGRGERQQEIIGAIIRKAASFEGVSKVKKLYDLAEDNVKTDIGLSDALSLMPHVQGVSNIEKLKLSGSGKMINSIYYYQLDPIVLGNVRTQIQDSLQ